MNILQGTTPSLRIRFKTDDLDVSTVTAAELRIRHAGKTTIFGMDELSIDTEKNAVVKKFTTEETSAMDPERLLTYQLRLWIGEEILGTAVRIVTVNELIS